MYTGNADVLGVHHWFMEMLCFFFLPRSMSCTRLICGCLACGECLGYWETSSTCDQGWWHFDLAVELIVIILTAEDSIHPGKKQIIRPKQSHRHFALSEHCILSMFLSHSWTGSILNATSFEYTICWTNRDNWPPNQTCFPSSKSLHDCFAARFEVSPYIQGIANIRDLFAERISTGPKGTY